MKIPIQKHEIRRILGGRHENLHRDFLGMDITDRRVEPIYRNVFYVSYLDPTGWNMYKSGTPAICDYRDGFIYCYWDILVPLTEARLVHEFAHRAARFRRSIGVWSSGVAVSDAWIRINEAITEYLTCLLCGSRYEEQVRPENRYLIYLPAVRRLEEEIGRQSLVRCYLDHDVSLLKDYVTPAGRSGYFRFR